MSPMNGQGVLPEWFKKTAVGKKVVGEAKQQLEVERREHVAAIEESRKRQKDELPPLVAIQKKAEAVVQSAHGRLLEAQQALVGARSRKASRP